MTAMDTFTLSLLFTLFGLQLAASTFSLYLSWHLYQRRTPVSTGFESQVLERLEKLNPPPPPKPPVPLEVREALVTQAVNDGVLYAEQYARQVKKDYPKEVVTGADKHGEAMKAARRRLEAAGIDMGDAELAQRIVVAHAHLKGTKRLG